MKKISHQIIDSEEKKYNIEIKVFPLSFIEYYRDILYKLYQGVLLHLSVYIFQDWL